jgi:hypothetical protein
MLSWVGQDSGVIGWVDALFQVRPLLDDWATDRKRQRLIG